jgi:hypothetical protein
MNRKFKWGLIKASVLLAPIVLLIILTLFGAVRCWLSENEPVLRLIIWIVGIGGAWMVTDKIREDIDNRRRNANYGFYFNLTTHLSRLKSKTPITDDAVFDYFFIVDPNNENVSKPDDVILANLRRFVSQCLDFLATQQNIVPPNYEDENALKRWYDALASIVGFLSELENICDGIPIERDLVSKEKHDDYKNLIRAHIDEINTQIKKFRNEMPK